MHEELTFPIELIGKHGHWVEGSSSTKGPGYSVVVIDRKTDSFKELAKLRELLAKHQRSQL